MDYRPILRYLLSGRDPDDPILEKVEDPRFKKLLYYALLVRGEPKKSLKGLEEFYHTVKNDDSSLPLHVLYSMSLYVKVLIRFGDTKQLKQLEEEIQALFEITDSNFTIMDYYGLANLYREYFHYQWYIGHSEKSLGYADKALQIFRDIEYYDFYYLLLANKISVLSDLDLSLVDMDEIETIETYYRKEKMPFFELQTILFKSTMYKKKGQISKSIQTFEEALQEDQVMDIFTLNIYEELGDYYQTMGLYTDSNEMYDKALIRFRELNEDDLGLGRIQLGIGKNYFHMQQYQMALNSFEEALRIFVEISNKEDIVMAKINLAKLYIKLRQFDRVRSEIYEIEILVDELNNNTFQYFIKYLKSLLKINADDAYTVFSTLQDMEELLNEELPFELELNLRIEKCKIQLKELKVVQSESKLNNLNEDLNSLIDLARKENLLDLLVEAATIRANLFAIQRNSNEAFDFLDEIREIVEKNDIAYFKNKLDNFIIEYTKLNQHLMDHQKKSVVEKEIFETYLDKALSGYHHV